MTAKKKHEFRDTNMAPVASRSSVETGTMSPANKMAMTNYAEIQKNELAVLQSIYMEDFEEVQVKAAAWSVRPPPQTHIVGHG
jgi:hypothetical protein